jgi:molybdopterin synthase sulfur carrier subunit
MMIKILYFASLREQIGRGSDAIELKQPMSALDAWKQATGRDALTDNLLIAINQQYVSQDTLLKDGDEVAFFPPVTGG